MKKNKMIAFFLELLCPGFGYIYADPTNVIYKVVASLVFVFKCYTVYTFNQGINTFNDDMGMGLLVTLFFLISTSIVSLPFAFFAMDKVDKKNKGLDEDFKKKEESKIMIQKENELNKYKSVEFITDLEKIYNLYKNSLLNEQEFNLRKNYFFKRIEDFGIKEDAEDFLSSILILNEENILTKDELIEIKKMII